MVSTPQKPQRGCPCMLRLGTGETQDFNWQERAFRLAGSVPQGPGAESCLFATPVNAFLHLKHGKSVPNSVLTSRWEILWFCARLFGQFHGFTHQLNGQFQGIPLEKSQPSERTFARRAAPPERTFEGVNAPSKPSFVLILLNLTESPTPNTKNAGFRHAVRSVKRSVALAQDSIQFWWRVRTDNCLSVP